MAILNYTEACVYDNGWNDTTLLCRGLIYNTANGEVVARPFPKFFNYGQAGAADIPLDAAVSVTDKVDGSLGILYRLPSTRGYAIATRGSFTSEQAIHASYLLAEKYRQWTPVDDGSTLLFEIVYPENRIVLDYGNQDDLILLGAVDIETGVIDEPHMAQHRSGWRGPVTEVFEYATLAEALAAEPRDNVEGFVVRRITGRLGDGLGDTIKLKTESYVRLHKLVTGLSERSVWEQIVAGSHLQEILEPLPDEFHDWVREVAARLASDVRRAGDEIAADYRRILGCLDALDCQPHDPKFRKTFAGFATKTPHAWALFSKLDGKPIEPKLWDQAKPEAFLTPSGRTYTEDAA